VKNLWSGDKPDLVKWGALLAGGGELGIAMSGQLVGWLSDV